jgi:NlpC/P60 family
VAFDAGTIVAHIDIDSTRADAELRRFEQQASQAERRRLIKLGIDPQEAAQMRRQFDTLDRQLTQDALRRGQSGQGSVLATLMGLSSPATARTQATQQQSAQRSFLSRLVGGLSFGGGGGGGINVGGGGGGNMGWGSGLFRGIGPGVIGIGARVGTIGSLAGLGLGALPALAGGIAPLGIGALGAGVIGLGAQQLIGSKQSPGQLYNPAQQLLKQMQDTIKMGAEPLVAPLRRAFAELGGPGGILANLERPLKQAFAGAATLIQPLVHGLTDLAFTVLPLLGQAFRAAAPFIQPLLDGITGLVAGLLRGLIPLIHAAAPAVRVLSQALALLGRDLGSMLRDFAPVMKASSVILRAILDVVSALFPVIGKLAAIFARDLAPVVVAFGAAIKALLPFLVIIGKVLADLAAAILGDLASAFLALAHLLVLVSPSLKILANALGQVFKILENTGVFASFGTALEMIVPALAQMINLIVRQLAPFLPVLITLFAQFSTILIDLVAAGLTTILRGVTLLLQHFPVLVPIIAAVTAAWLAWNLVMDANPIGLIIIAIAAVVGAITLLATHWHRVWTDISNWAMDAWNFLTHGWGQFLIPGLTAIRLAIQLVRDHWRQAWDDIKNLGLDAWHFIDNNVIQPWEQVLLHDLPNAFTTAVKLIGRGWGDVEGAVRVPVKWVVDNVINGLISAFDWVSGKVGGPHIAAVHPFGLQHGGLLPGYGGGDRIMALLEAGEAVVPKEHAASEAFRQWAKLMGIPGFAAGGPVGQGPIGVRVGPAGTNFHGTTAGGGIISKAADIGKIMAALATGNTTALSNAMSGLFPHGAGGGVGDMARVLTAIPAILLSDAVRSLIGLTSGLGGQGAAIARYAMSFAGRVPYVWAGTAVPGGADCSGFVETIYRHFGIGAPRTSEQQGAWVKRGAPTTGGLAFYNSPAGGPPPGHVALVGFGGNVISQGGGLGPQIVPLHSMPFMFAGVPPGGSGGEAGLTGSLRNMAIRLLALHGWGGMWTPFNNLETREAGWNLTARNPGSGAYGLAQFINGPSEYYLYGGNPNTAAGQLTAMMNYIGQRYGNPANAWTHEQGYGWYDSGGWLPSGHIGINASGQPEAVLTRSQFAAMASGADSSDLISEIRAQTDALAELLGWLPDAVGGSLGDVLNGVAQGAVRRAHYGAR